MKNYNSKEDRLGKIGKNKQGSTMTITKYNSSIDIWVEFEKGNQVHTNWNAFIKGKVRNVYDKSAHEVGFFGEGKYKTRENYKQTKRYTTWIAMLERCYSENFHKRHPTYKECTVAEEWHNFQNFAKWYDENYYEVDGECMEMDKDILVKGNKVYSSITCVFVPKRINLMFVKRNAARGNLPIGVIWNKRDRKYQVDCKDEESITVHLGKFHTIKEAFESYKTFKEDVIKKVANKYKERIPNKLYIALLNYKVEIDD